MVYLKSVSCKIGALKLLTQVLGDISNHMETRSTPRPAVVIADGAGAHITPAVVEFAG